MGYTVCLTVLLFYNGFYGFLAGTVLLFHNGFTVSYRVLLFLNGFVLFCVTVL
jgi:hypothetical protein